MSTRPDLIGAVASAQALGSVALLAGGAGSLPVLLGHTGSMGGTTVAVLALVIFAVPFAWFVGPRRAWYRERLAAAGPAPRDAVVIAADDTFQRVTRPLTPVLVGAAVIELLVAYGTGVPIGLALAGVGAGLLSQARWLARQERSQGIRLLCPSAPGRVAADDPHLDEYRAVPFYTLSEDPSSDPSTS